MVLRLSFDLAQDRTGPAFAKAASAGKQTLRKDSGHAFLNIPSHWCRVSILELLSVLGMKYQQAPFMTSPNSDIRVFPDPQGLTHAAAEHLIQQASLAINTRGRFTIALAGGSTPKSLYALLATPEYRTRLDWEKIEVFWAN